MSDTPLLEVRNWRKFQHYTDRSPPWIKLHFETLSSQDWVMLSDASRVLAIACMLIASRHDGKVPADPEYLKRVAYLKSCDFGPLIKCGFLIPLANDSALQADARPEERRGETETEEKREDSFISFWKAVPKKVAKGHALKAYAKAVKKAEPSIILEAMKQYAESVAGKDREFIAHPATWLNGERWLDETGEQKLKAEDIDWTRVDEELKADAERQRGSNGSGKNIWQRLA